MLERFRAYYAGDPTVTPEPTLEAIDRTLANNIESLGHCNGDVAADQLLAATKTATDKCR